MHESQAHAGLVERQLRNAPFRDRAAERRSRCRLRASRQPGSASTSLAQAKGQGEWLASLDPQARLHERAKVKLRHDLQQIRDDGSSSRAPTGRRSRTTASTSSPTCAGRLTCASRSSGHASTRARTRSSARVRSWRSCSRSPSPRARDDPATHPRPREEIGRRGDYEAGLAFNRIYAAVTPSLAHWKDKVPSGPKRDYLERQLLTR